MVTYIGTKIIDAEPCTAEEFDKIRPLYYSGACREGYKVKYEDEYISWSPKDVFEKAYRKVDGMNFGLTLEALRKGFKVTRKNWNGKGMWIELQIPDAHSKMTRPYMFLVCPKGSTKQFPDSKEFERIPWVPSQTDIFADDWMIVE